MGSLFAKSLAFVVLLMSIGCGGGRDSRTIGDLVQHFRETGINGEYSPTFAGMIGATEGGRYFADDFRVEIYVFKELSQAESLEKSGLAGSACHRNGRFILITMEGEKDVLPVFNSF